ncbi:MAG: FMN-binding protein [Lachnospiraceae bacterium]|nr:FMN-binding protein [Lachnospiraceae bacterium]
MYLFRGSSKNLWSSCYKIGAVLLGILLLTHTVTYFIDLAEYKEGVKTIELTGVTAAGVLDGSYIGQYDVGYIYAKVEVIVENEQIKEIKLLEHNNERGGKAELILSEILEKQTTDVDAVSGATNSSMVIKKAVENALSGK